MQVISMGLRWYCRTSSASDLKSAYSSWVAGLPQPTAELPSTYVLGQSPWHLHLVGNKAAREQLDAVKQAAWANGHRVVTRTLNGSARQQHHLLIINKTQSAVGVTLDSATLLIINGVNRSNRAHLVIGSTCTAAGAGLLHYGDLTMTHGQYFEIGLAFAEMHMGLLLLCIGVSVLVMTPCYIRVPQ